MLERGFVLFNDPTASTPYAIPDATDIDVFRKAIEGLPAQDHPGLFGMHSNADLAFRSLQVREGAGGEGRGVRVGVCSGAFVFLCFLVGCGG